MGRLKSDCVSAKDSDVAMGISGLVTKKLFDVLRHSTSVEIT
jgi:hypothetical protein